MQRLTNSHRFSHQKGGAVVTKDHPSTEALRDALLSVTPAQEIAVETLAMGSTHSAAAERAGVSRETVTRWAGHHMGFRAALRAFRNTLNVEQADMVRAVRSRALRIVAENLEDADKLYALAVLR